MFIFVDGKRIGFGLDKTTLLPSPIMRIGLGTEIIVVPPAPTETLKMGNGRILTSFADDGFSFEIYHQRYEAFVDHKVPCGDVISKWISLVGQSLNEQHDPMLFYLIPHYIESTMKSSSCIFYLSSQIAHARGLKNFQRIIYKPFPANAASITVLQMGHFIGYSNYVEMHPLPGHDHFHIEANHFKYKNAKELLSILRKMPSEIYFSFPSTDGGRYHISHSSGLKISILSLSPYPDATKVYSLSQSLLLDLLVSGEQISTFPPSKIPPSVPSTISSLNTVDQCNLLHFVENDLFRTLMASISTFMESSSTYQKGAHLIQGASCSGKSVLLQTIEKRLSFLGCHICKYAAPYILI